LSECDLIFHAGDILDEPLLERLRQLAPVHAVRGNNDRTLGQSLEEVLEAEVAGVSVAMVHDSGPKAARPARLRQMFPAAQLVIFGHSHVPVNELGENGQILFNPGSPTLRRSQPVCSYGEIVFGQGGVLSRDVIPLP
jgi:putative phosphoesterase